MATMSYISENKQKTNTKPKGKFRAVNGVSFSSKDRDGFESSTKHSATSRTQKYPAPRSKENMREASFAQFWRIPKALLKSLANLILIDVFYSTHHYKPHQQRMLANIIRIRTKMIDLATHLKDKYLTSPLMWGPGFIFSPKCVLPTVLQCFVSLISS